MLTFLLLNEIRKLSAEAIDKTNDIGYNNDRETAEYKQLHKVRGDFYVYIQYKGN